MRIIPKIFFSLALFFLLLIIAEIAVRFIWLDLPDHYLSIYKYPIRNSELTVNTKYEHIPNWRGYATGVKLNFNEDGLRAVSKENYKDKKIILYSGDSIFFGYGLKDKFTITEYLNNQIAAFPEWHHLNNGVCGYNFLQIIESMKFYNHYYNNIKYNFLSFIHNDLEDLYYIDECDTNVLYPQIKSAYFIEPDKNTFLYRLMNLLLPDDLTNERYINKVSIRKIFIRYSKLYLAAAMSLKRINLALAASEKPNIYLFPNLKISEKLIYQPLYKTVKNLKEYVDKNNIKYSVVLLLDHIIEGAAVLKIHNIFEQANINFYNLAMFMPDKKEYAQKFILGWDSHFNRHGSFYTAQLLKKIIDSENIIIPQNSDFQEIYKKTLSQYLEKNRKYEERQKTQLLNDLFLSTNYINFDNSFEFEKYFIYGYWRHFPINNKKMNIKLDGVWTTEFGSICFAKSE
ncbi:MAG TPA: hypothetical protein PLM75_02670, partial [bacterium]|nr:hypothetical protein [bacterium]